MPTGDPKPNNPSFTQGDLFEELLDPNSNTNCYTTITDTTGLTAGLGSSNISGNLIGVDTNTIIGPFNANSFPNYNTIFSQPQETKEEKIERLQKQRYELRRQMMETQNFYMEQIKEVNRELSTLKNGLEKALKFAQDVDDKNEVVDKKA